MKIIIAVILAYVTCIMTNQTSTYRDGSSYPSLTPGGENQPRWNSDSKSLTEGPFNENSTKNVNVHFATTATSNR